jgi:hypothetical protein
VNREHGAPFRTDQLKTVDLDRFISLPEEDVQHLARTPGHKVRNDPSPNDLRVQKGGRRFAVTPADRVEEAEHDLNVLALHLSHLLPWVTPGIRSASSRRSPRATAQTL